MLFTGIVFTLIGIMARTYAGIFEIHDSTWKAMKASIVRKVAALAGQSQQQDSQNLKMEKK